MKTFDDERNILKIYRMIPSFDIKYIGRFFQCLRIERLTKSVLFAKSWKDSSSKDSLPPDFHNERHHIMMEIMRVDDCVNEIDGKKVVNSYERANKSMKKVFGNNYKNDYKDTSLFFIPDTRNSNEFNFKGYYSNFKRVLNKHSDKVEEYHKNYPKCKTTVFLVLDESNNYIQVFDKKDLKREDEHNVFIDKFIVHESYKDKKIIELIENSNADYVIWIGYYKNLFVNGKKWKAPRVCIFDVKHLKNKGYDYNHELMFKVKEEV